MGRGSWFNQLLKHTSQCDLVFLDPDNGLQVKSKPYGRSKSSKYIYKREVKQLWQSGKSLLIYQHFIREKREVFIERMLRGLAELTEDASITAFTTSHVVFFMILQPKHTHLEDAIVSEVNQSWSGQVGLYHPNNLQIANDRLHMIGWSGCCRIFSFTACYLSAPVLLSLGINLNQPVALQISSQILV